MDKRGWKVEVLQVTQEPDRPGVHLDEALSVRHLWPQGGWWGDDGLMAAEAAVEHERVERLFCWCCGNGFDERDLTRLGTHPEVGVCTGCARWLHRRARARADAGRGAPGVRVRRGVAVVRGRVMRAGAQDWPVVGSLLRRLDRHLP